MSNEAPTDALRLVPVEPTEAMLQAGWQKTTPRSIYAAMLAAAPASPLPGGGDEALIAELKEAREVIARLGSSEAFDMPQAISGPLAGEIRARMDYARAFLARNGKGEG